MTILIPSSLRMKMITKVVEFSQTSRYVFSVYLRFSFSHADE